jgi:hypothetical protein
LISPKLLCPLKGNQKFLKVGEVFDLLSNLGYIYLKNNPYISTSYFEGALRG